MGMLCFDYWPEHQKYTTRVRSKLVSYVPNEYRQGGEIVSVMQKVDVCNNTRRERGTWSLSRNFEAFR